MKPLYEALRRYSDEASAVFHMPGHKMGRGFLPGGVFDNPAAIDVTELDVTDDLHNPRGPLREAQDIAARVFGAGKTWFLVNGSSCGIQAMIAANCASGQKLLISRDFHYQAFNAARLAGAIPVYIPVNEGGVLTPDNAERAIYEHPDAAALYLTRPGYYGDVCDITEIVRLAHARGIPVLVDEAHGAHLKFSDRLPICALDAGADFCVQSAHKTLPAFTQCAFAHASGRAVSDNPDGVMRFSEALRIFQTSSPSFMLTASLDYAREYMDGPGRAEMRKLIGRCADFYDEMSAVGYGVPDEMKPDKNGRYGRDVTRLVLGTRKTGLSGVETDRLLWSRYKIKIEMSDPEHIVMISTVADGDADFSKLKAALKKIMKSEGIQVSDMPSASAGFDMRISVISDNTGADNTGVDNAGADNTRGFSDWLFTNKNSVTPEEAVGCVSACMLIPYPPGIPLLCPGETVTRGLINKIYSLLQAGVRINTV